MEFSISTLLDSFGDDKLIAPKLLEKKLECDSPQKVQHLQITLDALERVGILAKDRGKYRRIEEEGVVEGKLRCSSKGFCFAIQAGEGTDDIYIRESQLNSAWNGDRVLVKVTKEGRRRRSPEGEVRLIMERSNPSVLAHVKENSEGQTRAVPLDDRLLFELALQETEDSAKIEEAKDQLVHVEIMRYPLGSNPPVGKIAQILGSDAQSAADTELVFCKYDLPRKFVDALEEAAEGLPKKPKKTDQKKRQALQKLTTITIGDGSQAPYGHDHGFSIEKTKEGHWVIGVHIVDFTSFVPLGSALDEEARKRAACITLGDQLVPIFPATLMERVGGLTAKAERLAFSLMITCDENGVVQEFDLQPSVIKVDSNLEESLVAQALERDRKKRPGKDLKPLSAYLETLDQLQEVSQKLKEQRYQRGSFDLWGPEDRLDIFGDNGLHGAARINPPEAVRAMVAEFLLLANQLVFEHIQKLSLPAIFQHQAAPEVNSIQDIIKLSENLGWPFELTQDSVVQPKDFQTLCEQFKTSQFAPMLYDLLALALDPVTLSSDPGPHFTQAVVQHYGQFTSPGHRYSDFLNHHVLNALFAKGRDRRNSQAKDAIKLGHSSAPEAINWNVLPPSSQRDLESAIQEAIPQLNERLKLVLQAEKDLNGLKKTKTMQGHTGEVFPGIITGIQSYGFFVRLESLRVEGLVHVSSLKDDWYEYRSRQQTLIGRKNRQQYRLGDTVEVEVKSVDYYRQQIDLAVVGGGSEASDEDIATAPTPDEETQDETELLDIEEEIIEDSFDEDFEEDDFDEEEDTFEIEEEEEDDEFEDALDEYVDEEEEEDDLFDDDDFEDE